MLISTTRILTELRLKLLCLESDKMKKKDRMREEKRENRMISRSPKFKIKRTKKEATHIKRLIDSTSGSQATNHNRERYSASL